MAGPGPAGRDCGTETDHGDPSDRAHAVRADLIAGAVLALLGVMVVYWSWTMPRLENRGVPPMTVPGLVPGVLGAILAGLGGVLALRSLPALGDSAGWRHFARTLAGVEARRATAVVALVLLYALGLVGLVSFWLATALFVLAFVLVFEVWLAAPSRPLGRSLLTGALQAAIVGAVVVLVFERGFLVRLP
jgi:putative tricarboxylic transport membrane protein